MTIIKQRIEITIPRKRRGDAQAHEKTLHRFYEQILQAILRHVQFDIVKCIVLASPGFVKDQCMQYILLEAQKRDLKPILENKARFVLAHSSSGHKHSLQEILQNPQMASQLADTKATREVRALQSFYQMLNNDANRSFYGYRHVSLANEKGAIQTLLVSDSLFRSPELSMRKRYVNLVESVREGGGEVLIFSSLHVSGEQLSQLSGVAAILRFPLPEIDEEEEEEFINETTTSQMPEQKSPHGNHYHRSSSQSMIDDHHSLVKEEERKGEI